MGRILSIDFGQKRVGLAVTDELRIIATALETVHSKDVFDYLDNYFNEENVDIIVVGDPKQMNNTASLSVRFIDPFVKKLRKRYPEKKIVRYDERFTSKMAEQTLIDSGINKKARRDKSKIDRISAVLILQSYLASKEAYRS